MDWDSVGSLHGVEEELDLSLKGRVRLDKWKLCRTGRMGGW